MITGPTFSIQGIPDFALLRLNQDGSLDTTFGIGGKVTTDFAGGFDIARALVLDKNGKIVVAGSTLTSVNNLDFALARYNTNGTLDSTFGIGGKIITDFFGGTDEATSIAIDLEGRLVTAGFATSLGNSTSQDFALVRYVDGESDFDLCLQDRSNGNILKINSITGNYQFFNCPGLTLSGTGNLIKKGNLITLQHYTADRRVVAKIDRSAGSGIASVLGFSQGRTFTIIDKTIRSSVCDCSTR